MNKLNIATTGYPGTTKSWRFVKESYEMIADALAKLVDPDSPVVITGVKVNGTDVTEGYIAWKGELFYFAPGKKTDYVVIIEDREAVEYNTNPTNSGQLEIHDTYITRYAKCGDQGEGVDEFPFSSLKRISSVLDIDQRTGPASVTSLGVVEIATQTEVNAGTDSTRAVTPATLANRTATETRKGVIEIATQAEVDAGTDHTRAVTPATLATAIENAKQIIKSGTVDFGIFLDTDYQKTKTISIPATYKYLVIMQLYIDSVALPNNADIYFVITHNKQLTQFSVTVKRRDDGGNSSGNPHIYVDYIVLQV